MNTAASRPWFDNMKGVPSLAANPVKQDLEAGLLVTVNSDDPSYFGGYLNDNYRAVLEHLGLTETEVIQLARNSFVGSFMSGAEKQEQLDRIDRQVDTLHRI